MPDYDPEVIQAIHRRAAQVQDPRARRRYLRAALQTGIVESGLRNLNYGDSDSLGWRQERQQFYSNPTNIQASVDRFFNEAAQLDRGQPSWELAADVQRPAAQFRGRYKDVAGEAARLLGDASPSGQPGSPSGAAGVSDSSSPAAPSLPGPNDFTSLLSSLVSRSGQQAAPAAMQVAAPQFSARAALPQGFTPPTPDAPAPAPEERPVSQALSLLETLRASGATEMAPGGSEPAEASQTPSVVDAVSQRRDSRKLGGIQSLGNEALEVAADLGFKGHSGQRSDEQNAAVGGADDSDHLMREGRMAYDIPMTGEKNLSRVGSSIARRFGIRQTKPGWWEGTIKAGRGQVRVQIIAGAQHDHGDHVHVGFRQA